MVTALPAAGPASCRPTSRPRWCRPPGCGLLAGGSPDGGSSVHGAGGSPHGPGPGAGRAPAGLAHQHLRYRDELQATDSSQLYRGQLRGVHEGVGLRFLVRLSRRPAGWRYQLLRFEVRSPTGQPGLVHWLPL
ncbi:MAG: hypothetical protein ACRYFX_16140 [Janthinobacterium lividum]